MKKIILLVLTTLMMIGCDTKLEHSIYCGNKWDILKINDSIYFMIPKYEKYSTPYVLNLNDKDSCYFYKKHNQKELKDTIE